MLKDEQFRLIYSRLYEKYGPQHWWPASSTFEMFIGAILTQNTSWSNVEKALDQLGRNITPRQICRMDQTELAEKIRSSGYYKVKALRLKEFSHWCLKWGYTPEVFKGIPTEDLRSMLLKVNGIGKETADSMILYGFKRPIFVVDAYTRRLLKRLDPSEIYDYDKMDYDEIQDMFHRSIRKNVKKYNEYHALIVTHSKRCCYKCDPDCMNCPIADQCKYFYNRMRIH